MANADNDFDGGKLRALLNGTDNPAVAQAETLLGSFDDRNPVHRLLSELASLVVGEGELLHQDEAIQLVYQQLD